MPSSRSAIRSFACPCDIPASRTLKHPHDASVCSVVAHGHPHCSAIAAAMPGKVLLLALLRSSFGSFIVSMCHLGSFAPLAQCTIIGSTIFVGFSRGNPFNHSPVFFFSGSPKKNGSMYWSGFLHLLDMMHTGFSIAMRSQSAFANCMKNATASSLSLSLCRENGLCIRA